MRFRLAFLWIAALALLAEGVTAEDAPRPLSAEAAAEGMQLPEGFRASVFAAEPDVVQPIGFTTDERGRLWVAECLSYPAWQPEDAAGEDRVSIFEDADGDGRFDKKTVFYTGRNITSVELGFGGAYVLSPPQLLFIPDRDRDDRPDGEPEVLLDGFTLEAKHNIANGLRWGPDGWLYGLHGILETSLVGPPDAAEDPADKRRTMINCGVWRFHPVRHTFEAVCHGTTNPWGLDYDQYGQFFITNCVIQHLFHVIPGAHYIRMYGQDLDQQTYALMPSIADYLHWGGGPWQSSRGGQGVHDAPGGGHAHAGCMVYLGDNWPAEYRGRLYTLNIHGQRANCDVLKHEGSGYDSDRGPDLFRQADPWFRGLEMKYGPDGGVFVSDWNDTGECHDYEDIQRGTGRIYKITYGQPKPAKVDLAKESTERLIERQRHENAWYARTARRILHERAARGQIAADVARNLWAETVDEPDTPHKLRLIWTLNLIRGGLGEALTETLLKDDDPYVRGWAIRLATEQEQPVSASLLRDFARLAETDPSPVVRLHLASALQRLPVDRRWNIAEALVAHAEDADDQNLPLMNWYAIAPLVEVDPARAVSLIGKCQIPLVRQNLARRLTALSAAE